MAGLRIECTPEEAGEIHRRIGHVLHTKEHLSMPYSTKKDSEFYYYLRVYLYEKDTVLDQLEAALKDLEDAILEKDRLLAENAHLKEELGKIPKPRPWDAVPGGNRAASSTLD